MIYKYNNQQLQVLNWAPLFSFGVEKIKFNSKALCLNKKKIKGEYSKSAKTGTSQFHWKDKQFIIFVLSMFAFEHLLHP